MKKEEALEFIRNNWKEILIGVTIVLGAVLLAILAFKLKKLWNEKNAPKYKILECNESTCERISGIQENDKESEKLLFFNEKDLRQLKTQVLIRIKHKIEENNAGRNSAEVHFLIDGEPGNGKTSLARGVGAYIAKEHNKKVLIMIPNGEWLTREEGLIVKNPQTEQKLGKIFDEARKLAKARDTIVILNFEEVDYIFNNPKVAAVILQELSPTDPTKNKNLLAFCTTNNKEAVYSMRKEKKQQDTNSLSNLLGEPMPENKEEDKERVKELMERLIASIKRRLTEITISPPDADTISKILNHLIICEDKKRKEETINAIIPIILGCNTAYITGTVVPNINLDLQTKEKNVEEIVINITEIISREKKQNRIELLKTAVKEQISKLYSKLSGKLSGKFDDPFLRENLQISQINEQNGPFKNLETLKALCTSYNEVLGELKEEQEPVLSKLKESKMKSSALQGGPWYGSIALNNDLNQALRTSHRLGTRIIDALETEDDIKNLMEEGATLEKTMSKLEEEVSDLKQESEHLSLKIKLVQHMIRLIERLIKAIEKEEAAKAAPNSHLYGVRAGLGINQGPLLVTSIV